MYFTGYASSFCFTVFWKAELFTFFIANRNKNIKNKNINKNIKNKNIKNYNFVVETAPVSVFYKPLTKQILEDQELWR